MAKSKPVGATPLMEQYLQIKAKHKDSILLYRMGDFYETFYQDARVIAKVLGIALTRRAHGKSAEVPLAGFPYHALDNYLHKLVRAGHRVAICEQVEDPKMAKGIVKREVIEIVTPGATISDKLLDHKNNNFLAAIHMDEQVAGIALADVSTGEFYCSELNLDDISGQLLAFQPKEILLAANTKSDVENLLAGKNDLIVTTRDDWIFSADYARESLLNHFRIHSLKGFGLENLEAATIASGAVLNYLQENYKSKLEHFHEIRVLNLSRYMILDEVTRRNLEIHSVINDTTGGKTLLSVLDQTRTSMGGRLLKKWINHPLRDVEEINHRLDLVLGIHQEEKLLSRLQELLQECADIERIIARISTGRANARDLKSLSRSLEIIPEIKKLVEKVTQAEFRSEFENLDSLPKITELIDSAIVDEPPQGISDGGIIRQGFNKDLDELKEIAVSGKDWLLKLQNDERRRTGIQTLKINFNRVFGYYIEITKSHLDKVPADYIRKQTLVNAERFITPELKEKEDKILHAEERMKSLEYEIFQNIRTEIASQTEQVQVQARQVALLDCLCSLAAVAHENNYIRPEINGSKVLKIRNGRHPVVEKYMKPGEEFVPNDVYLNPDEEQIWIITGPNMAGKSTFLRQVALIVFMAQIGSFVSAEYAEIGVVDRIFTRVGASDNLTLGESTFLVEMNETANILNNAGPHSLILLDEIGRGTSTFDGLSIAWAVAEYLQNEDKIRAKTLFATHYHELTELASMFHRIRNYNVAVEEWDDQVIFLRKIVAGGTDNSYGIHVAQMAGLPFRVIERAREILENLEAKELTPQGFPKIARRKPGRMVDKDQLSLFAEQKKSELEKRLKKMDVNNITPMQALMELNELKKMIDD